MVSYYTSVLYSIAYSDKTQHYLVNQFLPFPKQFFHTCRYPSCIFSNISRPNKKSNSFKMTPKLPTFWELFLLNTEIHIAQSKVLPKSHSPLGGTDLCFLSLQPDTNLHCKTTDTGLVHCMVCLFLLVLTTPTHGVWRAGQA